MERINKDVKFNILFPKKKGKCRRCGKKLSGRQTAWCSPKCRNTATTEYFIARGYNSALRRAVKKRDKGVCTKCGCADCEWNADHILELRWGGEHTLSNLQTLCIECHKVKTQANKKEQVMN